MNVRNILLLWCLLWWKDGHAQETETYPTRGLAHADTSVGRKAVFLSYANDLFAGTDRYFTQGVALGVRHSSLESLDLLRFLSPVERFRSTYSITLKHDAYTPSTIRADSILLGDRPYAATATLQLDCISYDSEKKTFFYNALTLGVIGPAAKGREIQTAIHRATGDFLPLGWQYQIRNDILLNYTLRYERRLFANPILRFFAAGHVDAGTLQCRLGAGFNIVLRPLARTKSFLKPSICVRADGYAIGYDARLQGGVFNRTSPYVVRSPDVSRAVASGHLQFRLDVRRAGIGVEQAWLSREFNTSLPHAWGRVFVQYYF